MTLKEIADYHGVTKSAIEKWSPEKRRKAIVVMQSGAEPEIIKLIGEISQLCYIFDCKRVVGCHMTAHASFNVNAESAYFTAIDDIGEPVCESALVDFKSLTAVAELQKVKQTLESFIY